MADPQNNTPATAATPAPSPSPAASPSPAPAPAPVSETRKETTDSWVTPDVRKAMDFDPFTPAGEETVVPAPTNPDGTPSADGTKTGQPASVPVPTPTGGTPQPDDALAIARENNRLLNAVLSAPVPAQTPVPGTSTVPKAQTSDEILANVPEYNYTIPDQLLAGMRSEDPEENRKATAALISGVARGIHQTIGVAAAKRINELQASIPQMIQQTMRDIQFAQHVETDFYGKYPHFNNPQIRQIVARVWHDHAKATGNPGWDDKTRDTVAAGVLQIIQAASGTPAPVVPAAPVAVVPAAQPPAMFGSSGGGAISPRQPVAAGVARTQQDHMNDIL